MWKALRKAMKGEPGRPDKDCVDVGEWNFLIDSFEERVLFDSDYAMGAVADLPPEQSAAIDAAMGIGGPAYYGTLVREPSPEEVKKLTKRLRKLTIG
jgi:hypothetical protein